MTKTLQGPLLHFRQEQARRADIACLEAERGRRSLAAFLRLVWPIVEPPAPLVWGWHLDALCEHFEAVTRGQIRNLLVTLPPGCTKSILLGVAWPAWTWATDPTHRFLCAANEGDLATRDSVACRRLVESDWYQLHFPSVKLATDQNVKTWFDTTAGGRRQAVTVRGTVTGKKGDILTVDDPNDARKVESEAERKAVIAWWRDAFFDRVNDYQTGRRVVIGQRTHLGDLQGHILDSGGFEHLSIPEEYETTRRSVTTIGWEDPRQVDGELLRPERFGPTQVAEAKLRLGTIGYRAKHQQDPTTREGYRFKAAWFRRWTRDGDWFILNCPTRGEYRCLERDLRARFGTADGAASAKTSADNTAISSWVLTPRNDLVWLGCRLVKAEIPEQPTILREEYDRHRLQWVGIEAVMSNVALYQYASRTTMIIKKLDPGGADKLARAQPAIVLAEAGRLWLPHPDQAGGYPWDAIEAELLSFVGDGSEERNDVVDTLSYAAKCLNLGLVSGPTKMPRSVGGLPTTPGPNKSLRG